MPDSVPFVVTSLNLPPGNEGNYSLLGHTSFHFYEISQAFGKSSWPARVSILEDGCETPSLLPSDSLMISGTYFVVVLLFQCTVWVHDVLCKRVMLHLGVRKIDDSFSVL